MIDRLVVSRGPAMITHRGGVFFTREDLVVELNKETKSIPSAAFGPLTDVNQGVKASAKFRPVGEFEHLGVLWPYAATPIGRSIFGDADYPLLIQPLDNTQPQTRFRAAGISKMPDLSLTATDTLIGDCEFQMVGANLSSPSAADRLFVLEANAIDLGALPYDPTKLLIQAYSNRWLSTGTTAFQYGAAQTVGPLVTGKRYRIGLFVAGDVFTNVGAASNATGVIFTATGTTPTTWTNASSLQEITTEVAFDASAATLATALNAMATITAAGGVTVTGNNVDGYTVSFVANGVRTAISGTVTGMPGGTALRQDIVTTGAAGAKQVVLLQLAPWANFETREGMKVAFNLTLTEDTGDAIGHYDTIFGGLAVTATGLPQGITEAQMLAAALVQGSSAVRGSRLSAGAHDLNIVGEGVYFRLYAANLRKAGQIFGATKQRVPDLEWVASRSIGAGGVLNPLFYIGTAAPA